jgi:hypothetical protein
MSARFVISLVAVLLALAPAAEAKEITKAEVCGTDRCVALTTADDHQLLDGVTALAPDEPSAFVEVNVTFRGEGPAGEPVPTVTITNQVVLREGLVRGDTGHWIRLTDDATTELRATATKVAPFPADKLMEVAPEIDDPKATGAPRELRTPGADGDTGPGTLPLAAILAGTLAALSLALARLAARRRRAAPQP